MCLRMSLPSNASAPSTAATTSSKRQGHVQVYPGRHGGCPRESSPSTTPRAGAKDLRHPGWASSREVCEVDELKPGRMHSLHGYSLPKLGKGERNGLPYRMHQLKVRVMRRPVLKPYIMKMTQLKPHIMKMPRNSFCLHRDLPLHLLPHPRRRTRTNWRRCGTTSRL